MSSETVTEEFEPACLCQGVVPKEKRVDFEQRIQGKDGKWKWKCVLRCHKDCPEHGVHECHAD